jgi:hypothetical protein
MHRELPRHVHWRGQLQRQLPGRRRADHLFGHDAGLRIMLTGGRVAAIVSVLAAALVARADEAAAQSTIQRPGHHGPYAVELEPHLLATPFGPPGNGSGAGFGAGIRASFEIVHVGFVPSINDSIAIGVGADFLRYEGNGVVVPGVCTRFEPGPAGTNVCVEVSQAGGPSNYAFFPVTMQWNFWLTPKWSVFGEPGLMLYAFDYRSFGVFPALYLGGRYHFSDAVTLTMRVGYPTWSIGVSFFL